MSSVFALVPAAGGGERFGGDLPKQFLSLHGRPVLEWSLRALMESGVEEITVALPEDMLDWPESGWERVRWIAGGSSRQESVARCLEASTAGEEDLILVHDGARPAIAVEDVRATIECARTAGCAVLGRPVRDTLKRVEKESHTILATVRREELFAAETPQVFRRAWLEEALSRAEQDGFVGTDESALVERLERLEIDERVRIPAVFARHPNPKLTDPQDLPYIEALLAAKAEVA